MAELCNVMLEEQETYIHFMRTDDYATIYTTDRTSITKLDRLCNETPEMYQFVKNDYVKDKICGKTYKLMDKTLVSLRSKKRENNLTDEQKEAARERMKNLRNKVLI